MNSNQLGRLKNLTLSILLVFFLIMELASKNRLDNFLSVFREYQDVDYYQTGMNTDRTCYCIGVDNNGAEILSICPKGGKVEKHKLTDLRIPDDFRPADSYIGKNGDIFIGGRNEDQNELYLLRAKSDEAVLLLSVLSPSRYEDIFSHITEGQGAYTFLVKDEDGTSAYLYDNYSATLNLVKKYEEDETVPLAKLPDGTEVVFAGTDSTAEKVLELDPNALVDDEEVQDTSNIEIYVYFDHCWILNRTTANLWYCGKQKSGLVMNMDDSQYGNIVSLTVSGAGAVIRTDEERVFVKENPVSQEELVDPLNEAGPRRIRFVLFCLVAVACMLILFLLLEYDWRKRSSFVFRGTVFAVGVVITMLLVAELCVVKPKYDRELEDYLREETKNMCEQEAELEKYYWKILEIGKNDEYLDFQMEELFTDSSSRFFNRFRQKEDELYVLRITGAEDSIAAAGFPGAFRTAVRKAFEKGESFCDFNLHGRKCYAYTVCSEGEATTVFLYASYFRDLSDLYTRTVQWVALVASLVSGLVMAGLLLALSRRVRQLSKECDSFLEGKTPKMVPDMPDELGELTLKIENTILCKKQAERESQKYKTYCQNFIPDNLLNAFEIVSEEQLAPGFSMEKEMDLMAVTLFPSVKSQRKNTEEFYKKMNESFCLISKIVMANGGYLLTNLQNGIEAVFPAGEGKSIQAAVEIRQGITAVNKLLSEGKDVEIFIGLDRTGVRLGVTGEDGRMQLLARHYAFMDNPKFAAKLSEIRDLIVCSETVIPKNSTVQKRYIGVYKDGGNRRDLYEIYEGDAYSVRLAKTYSQANFEDGVRSMLDMNYEKARKDFLAVIEDNVNDTLALYYLAKAGIEKRKKTEENDVTG